MKIVTRFAPSPTGFLHIGGVRTAIFNWLIVKASILKEINGNKEISNSFEINNKNRLDLESNNFNEINENTNKSYKSNFLLRIEDTDIQRSDEKYIKAILEGLSWLGLDFDGEIFFQSKQKEIHIKIAHELLEKGLAYKCYLSKSEVEEISKTGDKSLLRKWRDCKEIESSPKESRKYVIRFKMPVSGKAILNDSVRGKVEVNYEELYDFVILREDMTPTYLFACVIDDHKMGITNVVRGDDHLINTFSQNEIYKSMQWDIPKYSHIPLIHDEDGKKLSKRNSAVDINDYKRMGILPEAMFNYLIRLGWSHGNDEIISVEQAIEWFSLNGIGKSPARLNMDKLLHINSHYIKKSDDDKLVDLIKDYLNDKEKSGIVPKNWLMIKNAISELKIRSKTVQELKEMCVNYFGYNLPIYKKETISMSEEVHRFLQNWNAFDEEGLRREIKESGLKLKEVAHAIRYAFTGSQVSPSIFHIMSILGPELSKSRVSNFLTMSDNIEIQRKNI
nr:glutamate--tRNA ligase [Candidatus Nesciobacter abundans]